MLHSSMAISRRYCIFIVVPHIGKKKKGRSHEGTGMDHTFGRRAPQPPLSGLLVKEADGEVTDLLSMPVPIYCRDE